MKTTLASLAVVSLFASACGSAPPAADPSATATQADPNAPMAPAPPTPPVAPMPNTTPPPAR